MDDQLIHQATMVPEAYLALGNEVFEADGATFIRNTKFPSFDAANRVAVTGGLSEEEIERLLTRVDEEYPHSQWRTFDTSHLTPPAFEARLALEGYASHSSLIMLLEGELVGAVASHDVRPIADEGAWREFARLAAMDWLEDSDRAARIDNPDLGDQLAAMERGKCPPVRWFLVYADGAARGYFDAWQGRDGVGQVENLYVEPAYRHRGFATALIARCVADCRERGAGPVVIVCDPGDTSKHIYAALGFRPVALRRSWRRRAAE